jgi:hypothetical protein
MRIESLVAACGPGGTHEIAVWHQGALDVIDLLRYEISAAGKDEVASG